MFTIYIIFEKNSRIFTLNQLCHHPDVSGKKNNKGSSLPTRLVNSKSSVCTLLINLYVFTKVSMTDEYA